VTSRAELIRKLEATLPEERFEHSLRVEKVAVSLARKYGVSVKKASIAALLHDCARRYRPPELLKLARRIALKIGPIEEFEPKLLHARLSAWLAKKEFKIKEADILEAIRRHTTGAPRMNKLEKIIFISDHLGLRALAARNLEKAVAESATKTLKYLVGLNVPIDLATVETRNYYLLKR